MKKFFQFTWLPILMVAAIVMIFGGASLTQAQRQNRVLEGKINDLSQKIDSLTLVQVAGTSTENQESSPPPNFANIQNTSEESLAPTAENIQPTPTPTPNLTPTPTATPKRRLKPAPTPTPTPIPQKFVTVEIQGLGSYEVELEDDDTAFLVLLRAGQQNSFSIDYQNYEGLGIFVNCIGGVCSHDNYYWAFYYNGQYSMVGASAQPVSEGDTTTWKFETW